MGSTSDLPKWSPSVQLSFDDDDDDWQEMPVIRSDTSALDQDDHGRPRYLSPHLPSHISSPTGTRLASSNAIGNLLDLSEAAASRGEDWRAKSDSVQESNYTRLGLDDDPDEENLNMRTQYLFDNERGMTPLNQLQATKNLLNEPQRIAYVGMCRLVMKEMLDALKREGHSEMDPAVESMKDWSSKILSRLFQHMDIESREQHMIDQLAEHGVAAEDLVGSLMTTHTVPNPSYDPLATSVENEKDSSSELSTGTTHSTHFSRSSRHSADDTWGNNAKDNEEHDLGSLHGATHTPYPSLLPLYGLDESSALWASTSQLPTSSDLRDEDRDSPDGAVTPKGSEAFPTARPQSPSRQDSLDPSEPSSHVLPGVSTDLTSADERITLDIRWTVLCDLFLAVIADSLYDARSRVLLGRCAYKLRLSWMDVVRFERRLTEALEVEEGISKETNVEVVAEHQRKSRTRRLVMMGAATLGGGLVIGLSAGLLAPVIGAGLAAGFSTIGIGGTSGFLAGAGGAAAITTAGTVTGMNIGGKGMSKRTQSVTTFEILPLHNNRRVNVFLTMPGFMEGANDDVRLPFSVMDQSMGDVLSVLWEPEMMGETGNIIKILTSEVLSQVSQQVLQATVLTALMSALQWPLMLTKLGYLIDNPWSNALDRARAAGAILADVLVKRHVGVRPVSLIGFSLGARAIFYALVELAKRKSYGIVQEVYLLGATVTAPVKTWREVRGVVAGRFVNGYCRKDWILGYLYRATTGGLQTVAGLSPVSSVPDFENVDLTEIVVGHMSYRAQMPIILAELGFRVTADHFDEPEVMEEDDGPREAPARLKTVKEAEEKKRMILNFTKKLKGKGARPQSLNLGRSASVPAAEPDNDPPRPDNPLHGSSSSARSPPSQKKNFDSGLSLSAGAVDVSGHFQTELDQVNQRPPGGGLFDMSAIRSELAKPVEEATQTKDPARDEEQWEPKSDSSIWSHRAGSFPNDPWKQ